MFARNFAVKYKPIKSNFVVLPEAYKRLVSTCKTGCLLLHFNDHRSGQYKSVYVSWSNAIQATNPFEEEEIGINTQLAELLGIKEGINVSCSVIQSASTLKSVSITLSDEDYQIAECSLERIQNDMLDQISIVGRYQPFVLWLNKSISVNAVVDNLSPSFNYGRIQNDTEISINRKVNPSENFLRTKNTKSANNDVDSKIKRRSVAVERSQTDVDIPQLKRNSSFVDSYKLQEAPEYMNGGSRRTSVNGWDSFEMTAKKPPSVSPRASVKRTTKDGGNETKNFNGIEAVPKKSIIPSASLTNIKSYDKRDKDKENDDFVPISNSLSASNIKRVQEKSKQFLEQLSSQESPKRKLLNSVSSSSIPKIITSSSLMSETKQNHKLLLEDIKKALSRESQSRHFIKIKIVGDKKKSSKFMQVNDVYVSKSNLLININQIHKIRTKEDKEYHIRVKCLDIIQENTAEIHPVLAKVLNLQQGIQVEVIETKLVCNCIENIEIIPHSDISENNFGVQIAKDIDEKIKKYINANTRIHPLILNQNQIFKLDDYLLTVKLYPISTTACCIDSEILRENLIDVIKRGEPHEFAGILQQEMEKEKRKSTDPMAKLVKVEKFDKIIDELTHEIHPQSNKFRILKTAQNNSILAGLSHSGKTTICNEIQKNLEARNVCVTSFNCSQYKGRKIESIVKDMRATFMECLKTSPSVYIIHGLDTLCCQMHDEQQSQENEYQQKLANNLRHLFEEFTHDYGHFVSILVSVSKLSNVNKIIHKNFGCYLFKNVKKIPTLDSGDRKELFKHFLMESTQIKLEAVDWDKFARITEGYKVGDISQFADRAIFLAFKQNYSRPILNEDILKKSLAISNKLYLDGIKTETDEADEHFDATQKIPGMDSVIETLEEVLVWPTKFPKIFKNSPLRNQAGVLLYGVPGSGKGFIVAQITKRWNLRLISIKGPELLAKYIGQSEENVRNLFEKAKAAQPCVLFFDEFESLAPRRGHDSTGVTDRVVNQLLTELDGVKSLEGVSIICATSRPDLIDPALLRSGRIDRLVECTLPNAVERLEIVRFLSKSLTFDGNVDFKKIAAKMNSFTGADIKSVLTTANMSAIEEELGRNVGKMVDEVVITQKHLENALQNTRASLNKQDIEKYRNLYDKFKNKKSVTVETPQRVSLA